MAMRSDQHKKPTRYQDHAGEQVDLRRRWRLFVRGPAARVDLLVRDPDVDDAGSREVGVSDVAEHRKDDVCVRRPCDSVRDVGEPLRTRRALVDDPRAAARGLGHCGSWVVRLDGGDTRGRDLLERVADVGSRRWADRSRLRRPRGGSRRRRRRGGFGCSRRRLGAATDAPRVPQPATETVTTIAETAASSLRTTERFSPRAFIGH